MGAQLPWLGGRGSPAGTGWHLGCGRSPSFQLGSDPQVSANLDFRKRRRDPRPLRLQSRLGCAPVRNFGLKSQGAQWMGWDLHGSNADAQLQTQQILLGTGAESLKRHRGGGGGGMNRPTGSSPSSTQEQVPFPKESTGPFGERQGCTDYDPQTQMRTQEKQSNPPENPEGGARRGSGEGKHCIIGSP